ncbi:MAG: hypothetical protein KID00_07575 [Clostridium argentinense]|uniref:DUF4240 domain-containing protein n=1 Tax=Clostridium faecium TaxID=2762223 RepID=A0ABR8YN61_9CLOT|nr:hypothetical protein [Clostridium faecium]MBD8045682.1 hypothetical protein [Clostridium faecium]MBS5823708.1 hypothetical protein [Clostridium argentinense]
MDIIINFHSEVRRYYIFNIAFWEKESFELGEKNVYRYNKTKEFAFYQAEEYSNSNSRKGILEFILNEIEKSIPEDFETIEELKKYIVSSCENAYIDINSYCIKSYSYGKEEIMYKAVEEEKEEFKSFIISLNEKRLRYSEPLFYRRVLKDEEAEEIKNLIVESRRNFRRNEEDSLFGDYFFIDKKVTPKILRNILINHGIKKIYEIDTSKEAYFEIDVDMFNPYGKVNNKDTDIVNPYERINREKFFSSSDMDWVIYADHEDYIRIDGKWLIDDIISDVPEIKNILNEYVFK